MTRRILLVPVALAALLTGCSRLRGLTSQESAGAVASEETTVYAAVIDSLFPGATARVLVADETADISRAVARDGWWLKRPSALRTTTFQDFRDKNAAPRRIASRPRSKAKVEMLPSKTVRAAADGNAATWRDVASRYGAGAGMVEFSRVGFRNDGRQAFLVVRRLCGVRCQEAIGVVAERDGNSWRVSERHVLAGATVAPATQSPARQPRRPSGTTRSP